MRFQAPRARKEDQRRILKGREIIRDIPIIVSHARYSVDILKTFTATDPEDTSAEV